MFAIFFAEIFPAFENMKFNVPNVNGLFSFVDFPFTKENLAWFENFIKTPYIKIVSYFF
jgi:hypothetical protein